MPYPYDLSAPAKALARAEKEPTPLGARHLHYIVRGDPGHWVVRKAPSGE